MRKYLYLSLMVCCLSLFNKQSLFAQETHSDSSSQQNALNNAITLFHASIGKESPLYNGPEYYFYDPVIKGNAYFLDVNSFAQGSVYYDGAYYTNVPMLYDIHTDDIVVLLYNHFSKYSLLKERVKRFDFLDHHFININTDTLKNNTLIKSGFYDQLYNGKIEILVKRAKSIQTNSGGITGTESYFSPTKDYFLKKNNIYYSFSSQGSLLDILKDRKKELQQYIKANQIRYRTDPEDAMVKIASYYDHLTN